MGSPLRRLGASALYFVGLLILGFLAGGFVGSRLLTPEGGMGWDHLANGLGGMAVGVIVAIGVGILLVRRLSTRALLLIALGAIGAAYGLGAWMSANPAMGSSDDRDDTSPPAAELPAPQPRPATPTDSSGT